MEVNCSIEVNQFFGTGSFSVGNQELHALLCNLTLLAVQYSFFLIS
jgi:hypothetical protein